MKLSVLMSVRNGEQFLPNSITDIESNVSLDDEIIVIDDGSHDETGNMLRNWERTNGRVRVITTEPIGLVKALNLGLKEASNDWIARFDVDDRYPRNRLSTQRSLISSETSAIFCDYEFWAESHASLGVIPGAIFPSATAMSLVSSQRTPHPGVTFNRLFVMEAGGYREEDFPAEDISLWLRMSKSGNLVTAPKVLLNYRLSQTSISGGNRNLALAKTQRLIQDIGIDSKSVDNCLENWQDIFDEYSKVELGSERKVLFYRDLKNSLRQSEKASKIGFELKSILFSLAKEKRALPALYNLTKGKILRQKFRKL
jgi:glycosyltransferase involved in cell wall biosynthesis